MKLLLYLDQNILSDLRGRKLAASSDSGLKEFVSKIKCDASEIRVVYSSVHLDEIKQIPKHEYIDEHISLLSELNAIYIQPISNQLIERNPGDVWAAYLENENENRHQGVNSVIQNFDLFQRKLAGLPVEQTFDTLHSGIQQSLSSMLENAMTELKSIDPSSLSEEERDRLANLRVLLETQLLEAAHLSKLEIDEGKVPGPKPFRELSLLRGIDERLSPEDIIPAIEHMFATENNSFKWEDYFDNTIENQIARCYLLMNWAGYHADDFTKIKKTKDRFGASTKDMAHVQYAAKCHYLVSRDVAFSKKAIACFRHLKLLTNVITPEAFA